MGGFAPGEHIADGLGSPANKATLASLHACMSDKMLRQLTRMLR